MFSFRAVKLTVWLAVIVLARVGVGETLTNNSISYSASFSGYSVGQVLSDNGTKGGTWGLQPVPLEATASAVSDTPGMVMAVNTGSYPLDFSVTSGSAVESLHFFTIKFSKIARYPEEPIGSRAAFSLVMNDSDQVRFAGFTANGWVDLTSSSHTPAIDTWYYGAIKFDAAGGNTYVTYYLRTSGDNYVALQDANGETRFVVDDGATVDHVKIAGAGRIGNFQGEFISKLTAKNYVQDGLIAQWDGEYNAGYGKGHDASATAWVDLTGNNSSFTLATGWSFEDKALVVTRAMGAGLSGLSNVQEAFKKAQITAEIAYDETSVATTKSVGYSNYNTHMLSFCGTTYWMGHENNGIVGFNPNGAPRAPGFASALQGADAGMKVTELGADGQLGKHTLSCAQNGTFFSHLYDDAYGYTNTVTPNTSLDISQYKLQLNRHHSTYNESGMNGKYHSLRFYNRALTEDEYRVNRAIDKVRFFGVTPSSIKLPDGYRWNTTSGVALEKRSSMSVVGGDGTATVNGQSGDFWVDTSGGRVQLVATPAAGYKFVRWDGAGAIAMSDEERQSASVTASVGGDLKAVFMSSGKKFPTSKNYVPEGLLNLWDGLENGGYGVHVTTATSWTDNAGGFNLVIPKNFMILENGLKADMWSGAMTSINVGNGARTKASAVGAHQTIECAYTQTELMPLEQTALGRGLAAMFWIGSEQCCFGLMWNNSFRFNTHEQGQNATMNWGYETTTTLGQRSFSCAQNGSNWWIRVDGEDSKSGKISIELKYGEANRDTAGFNFKYPYYSTPSIYGFNGTYHCMRFYSRALSLEEAQVNRIIDCLRYFNAAPVDFTLPDGFRWDFSDGVVLERKNLLKAAEHGSYTVNGMARTDIGEFWAPLGESVPLLLSAVPEKGYRFSYWEGVEMDDAQIQSGELRALGNVKPVFIKDSGTEKGLYEGLVYDMTTEENDATRIFNRVKNSSVGGRTYARAVGGVEMDVGAYPTLGGGTAVTNAPVVRFTSPTYTNTASGTEYLYSKRSGLRLCDEGVNGAVSFLVRGRWHDDMWYSWSSSSSKMCRSCTIPIFTNGWDEKRGLGMQFSVETVQNYRFNRFSFSYGGMKYNIDDLVGLISYGVLVNALVVVRPIDNDGRADVSIYYNKGDTTSTVYETNLVMIANGTIANSESAPFMQLGGYNESIIGDAEYIKTNNTLEVIANNTALISGLRGVIASTKVWNRALSRNEALLALADRTGEKWTIGSNNASNDEFAEPDSATYSFEPETMGWSRFPKKLTAENPTVTLKSPIDHFRITEAKYLKYLTINPVEATLPTVAKVTVKANGDFVGTIDLNAKSDRTIFIRKGMVTPGVGGNIAISITRTDDSTGDVEFDSISFGGGEQLGVAKTQYNGNEFNELHSYSGFSALGETNVQYVVGYTRGTLTPNQHFLFTIPEKLAEKIPFVFTSSIWKQTQATPFTIYLNGVEVYKTPAEGIDAGVEFSFKVAPGTLRGGINKLEIRRDDVESDKTKYLYFDYFRFDFKWPGLTKLLFVVE